MVRNEPVLDIHLSSKRSDWLHFDKNEILILLVVFFYSISTAVYMPYAPVWLAQIFEVDSFLVIGLVTVLPNTVIALTSVFWGRLADKFGTKIFVLLGIGSAIIMYSCLLLFANTPIQFLIIILLGNSLVSAHLFNIYSMATLSINKRKEVVLGKMSIVMSLSWLIVSPIAGHIRDNINDTENVFVKGIIDLFSKFVSPEVASNPDMLFQLLIAVAVIIVAFCIAIFIQSKKPEIAIVTKKAGIAKKTRITEFPLIFALIMVLTLAFQACSSGFWSYNSVYFIDTLKITSQHYSTFLIITTAIGMVLSFLFSRVRNKKSNALIVTIFMGIQVFVYLFLRIFPLNATLGIILYSLPLYPIYQIPLYSLVTSHSSKERRSTAYGIYNALGLIGGILSTLLLGFTADRASSGIFVMLTITLILAFIVLGFSIVLQIFIRKEKEERKDLTAQSF